MSRGADSTVCKIYSHILWITALIRMAHRGSDRVYLMLPTY